MNHLENALNKPNHWGNYILIFIVAFVGSSIVGAIPLFAIIIYNLITKGNSINSNSANLSDLSAYGISQNLGLILMIIPFILGLYFTVKLVKSLHERTFSETINGTSTIRWRRMLVGFGVWFSLNLIALIIDYSINPENFELNFNLSAFIPLVFIAFILIPFQTTMEEYFFRGYLSQGIAAWTKNRWIVIIIPAIIFGLLHVANPEVKAYGFWLAMPQYVFFGLVFGLITVLDDGIELAMGIHAANNIFACIFLTNKSSVLQTPAVFNQLNVNPSKETISLIVYSLIALAILAYKYKWNFSVLNKRVNEL